MKILEKNITATHSNAQQRTATHSNAQQRTATNFDDNFNRNCLSFLSRPN